MYSIATANVLMMRLYGWVSLDKWVSRVNRGNWDEFDRLDGWDEWDCIFIAGNGLEIRNLVYKQIG